jgi:hypothetical protein
MPPAAPCTSPSNCGAGQTCNFLLGTCTPAQMCNSDQQCGQGRLCIDHQCLRYRTCGGMMQCPMGFYCRSSGVCAPAPNCATTGNCAGGQTCVSGYCQPPSCTGDAQCLYGFDCAMGKCVAPVYCNSSGQCPPNQMCETHVCR